MTHEVEVAICALAKDMPEADRPPFCTVTKCSQCPNEIVHAAEITCDMKLCPTCAKHLILGARAAGIHSTMEINGKQVPFAMGDGVAVLGPEAIDAVDPHMVRGIVCQKPKAERDWPTGPCGTCDTEVQWPPNVSSEIRKICTRCFVAELQAKKVPGADKVTAEMLEDSEHLAQVLGLMQKRKPVLAEAAVRAYIADLDSHPPLPGRDDPRNDAFYSGAQAMLCCIYNALLAEGPDVAGSMLSGIDPASMLRLGETINRVDDILAEALGRQPNGHPVVLH